VCALLNSLQMGFRTFTVEQRTSEVWAVLGAVKTEFGKFGDVLAKPKQQLQSVSNSLDTAEVRSRAIVRKLRDVEEWSGSTFQFLLRGPRVVGEPVPAALDWLPETAWQSIGALMGLEGGEFSKFAADLVEARELAARVDAAPTLTEEALAQVFDDFSLLSRVVRVHWFAFFLDDLQILVNFVDFLLQGNCSCQCETQLA
jgi:hypothetical protein